ncbi:aryldialkylphosphatase [Clostridium zeae]|uniref:Aryldialkylphosphatase n=1 Tax=Clostridium zeae TaxID=2759022 RepID=A0ABQ1E7X0_9CLOT|nr:hypothetical protein [Clostridium zeae]GFZ30771.1 aryldialkylphosphatase [Clostridium zeae]
MIYTVTGPVDRTSMGMMMAHEHFKWESDENFASNMYFNKQYDELYNQKIAEKVLPILKALKASGCDAVVEASPPIGGQNLKLLYELSKASKVKIIPCTGTNIPKYTYLIFKEEFEKCLAKRWIEDFKEGIDTIEGVKIKPGYIKLLFDRGKISEVDEAMLRAAALASKATGLPIHCHVLEAEQMKQVMSILYEMKVPPHKFVWAHADKESNLKTILAVAQSGYWVGFDIIQEGTYADRLNLLKHAFAHGYNHQVLLSQDYDMYEESDKENGTQRYCALIKDFVPHCLQHGLTMSQLECLLIENPSRFYDF